MPQASSTVATAPSAAARPDRSPPKRQRTDEPSPEVEAEEVPKNEDEAGSPSSPADILRAASELPAGSRMQYTVEPSGIRTMDVTIGHSDKMEDQD